MSDRPSKRRRCSHGDGTENCHFELWWAPEGEENPYADWTIVVESKTKKRSFTVHQKVLECKSDYFASIFQGKFSESSNKCSHFEFDDVIVERFDSFLDSLYAFKYINSKGCEMFRTTNANDEVVFVYLLDYFRVEHILAEAASYRFDCSELSWAHVRKYYQALEALPISFPYLQNILCESGAHMLREEESAIDDNGNIPEDDPEYHCLKELNIHSLMHFCEHEAFLRDNPEFSCYLLFILQLRCSEIPLQKFVQLASAGSLPCLEPELALRLLKLCATYSCESDADRHLAKSLHDIEARCIENIRTLEQSKKTGDSLQYLTAYNNYEGVKFSSEATSALTIIEKTCLHSIAELIVTGLTISDLDDFLEEYPFLRQASSAACILRKLADIGQFPATDLSEDGVSLLDVLTRAVPKAKLAAATKGGAVPLHVYGPTYSGGGDYYFEAEDGNYVCRSDYDKTPRSKISRDKNGTWVLESRGKYSNAFYCYTCADKSEYGDDFPPSTGWQLRGHSYSVQEHDAIRIGF